MNQKAKAQNMAYMAEVRGTFCELCGAINNLDGHHPDYNKPLEVVTLCRSCHKKLHNKNKEALDK